MRRFRPLIRGFFFYLDGAVVIRPTFSGVSVPSFGDSFFIPSHLREHSPSPQVSVPSFGDSFFILISAAALMFHGIGGFPSPHSGILFL